MPCDLVPPHWGGPFHVQVNVKASGVPPKRRLHVYNRDMRAVGCGYVPARGATHAVRAWEVQWEPGRKMAPCQWCFRKYTWPVDEEDPFRDLEKDEAQADPGAISGGSSSSSSSDESDSEEEGKDLLKVRPPPVPDELLMGPE